MKKLTRVIFGLAIVLLMALVTPALSANYDLVINNGRVMDPETMYDRVANIGIKDGRTTLMDLEVGTPGTVVTEANGIQELLANVSSLGAPAPANHFNNPGYSLVQELLVCMRARGMNVWGEIYPYAAGSTALNAVFLEPEVWVDTLGLKAMQERGRMQPGKVADITIFDPEKITDNATYEKGIVPSTSIPYVIVNGTIMVKDSEVVQDATFSGQPIRFEPVKSRFEPPTIENWQKIYYASPVDFGGGVPGSQPRRMDAPDVQPDTHGH